LASHRQGSLSFEEDKPQVITKLQFEKDTPISLGVLIDVSRGMGARGYQSGFELAEDFG
jgi:hypothetical protein